MIKIHFMGLFYDLTENFQVFWYTLNYNIIKLDMEDEQRDRK